MIHPFKRFWRWFTSAKYTYEKEIVSAIVTTRVDFKPKNKIGLHSYMFFMYLYAIVVFSATIASLAMLLSSQATQKNHLLTFSLIEALVFTILLTDTVLRWYSSTVRMRLGKLSYFLWPFSVSGLILIASLLPSLYIIDFWVGRKVAFFEKLENFKFLRIFRIVLLANLIPGISLFKKAMDREKSTLWTAFGIVILLIVLFTFVIYNIETSDEALRVFKEKIQYANPTADVSKISNGDLPIKDFLDALYFSTVTITTIGFGDIVPITYMGKIIVVVMSIVGIVVLALPAGIITGGFIQEVKEERIVRAQLKEKKDRDWENYLKAKIEEKVREKNKLIAEKNKRLAEKRKRFEEKHEKLKEKHKKLESKIDEWKTKIEDPEKVKELKAKAKAEKIKKLTAERLAAKKAKVQEINSKKLAAAKAKAKAQAEKDAAKEVAKKIKAKQKAAERLAAEKAKAKQKVANKIAAEKAKAAKIAAKKVQAEKLAAEKLAAKKAKAKQQAAIQLAAEKAKAKALAAAEKAKVLAPKKATEVKKAQPTKPVEVKKTATAKPVEVKKKQPTKPVEVKKTATAKPVAAKTKTTSKGKK